jgi:RNA polymerase sigma-70 factor (ECF subfamily)
METHPALSVEEQLRAWLAAGAYRPALTLLAETYLAAVFRYCLRMANGQTTLAEEVTQQVFEAACRGIAAFRAEASVKTWLFAIAHHRCLHALAQQHRRHRAAALPASTMGAYGHAALAPSAAEVVESHDSLAQLRAALAQAALEPVERSIVLLRFGLEVPQALSVAEIATVLGVSRDTVYRRLTTALTQLRRIMDDARA